MKRKLITFIGAAVLAAVLAGPVSAASLTPSTDYTVSVKKMKSDGATEQVTSTSARTDANGKLEFSLSTIPTKDEVNFIIFEIKNSQGAVVKRGIVPAPPTDATNLIGINDLADVQTEGLLAAAAQAGSDDPIMMAYALTLLRSPAATDADAAIIGKLGKGAILNGFETFLTNPDKGNVSAEKLANLKKCLIYNGTVGTKTLRDFTETFYDANAAATDADADKLMQQAGGFMAEMFMDAAKCADIDLGLINAAHNAAGDAAQAITNANNLPIMNDLSPAVQIAIEQAMSTFQKRIAIVKVSGEYIQALDALNASGAEKDRFIAAVNAMSVSLGEVEATFAGFYADPVAYAAANYGGDVAAAQAAIDQAYSDAWNTFMTDMASTADDITAMKAKVVTGFGFSPGQLPSDFGMFMNANGQSNWPIPQTVMVSWLGDLMGGGGTFSYLNDRDDTPIPSWVTWMGNCTKTADLAASCASFSGTWTGTACSIPMLMDQNTCMMSGGGNTEWTGTACQVRSDMLGMAACQSLNANFDSSSGKCVLMGQMESSCGDVGGTWTRARTNYAAMPAEMGAFRDLLALQEDINILDFERMSIWQGVGANPTGEQEATAKLTFENKLAATKGRLTATTNGIMAINDVQKAAILKLLMQPSLN